ncbi:MULTISPECIES: 8-oxo-dGTP diphosphatase MutT [unclassified Shewanella]|uniref:8-oxo-dGTP diphosphatase MutT n=1 Tax=unclassified Shewanella TaxID=196818 RepID=UPI001BC728C4|nr:MULTISPECIES: 8-oxo-dGTP diphosphatase MutT [unclassified Shewanella]GIU21603.1 7,8-dihydro-8-oxoguanine-triphosphatase [Shewanella sp. MBTL60-112-B1]GIU40932.1 7,8-dihydro-8-oxoguanine-triphosphatase [Shewanella sp. MBTL60-112-B2]
MSKVVHVAVGVIQDTDKRILLAKRPQNLHQGGKWEFPGGKVEVSETTSEALIRELKEEVNLDVVNTQAMMEIHHDYGDKQVFLDIHWVTQFSGEAKGLEGQQVRWVEQEQLTQYDFPEANKAILEKILSLS